MPELIDRAATLEKMCEMCYFHTNQNFACRKCNVYELIAEQPTIETGVQHGQHDEDKPLTNGDRIRQMTDEELVREFSESICNIVENCEKDISCYDCKMQWLKQEVSEEDTLTAFCPDCGTYMSEEGADNDSE